MFSVSKKGSNKKDFAVVDTVAELEKLSNMRLGSVVTLKGYYAAGDFGEPIELIVEAAAGGVNSFTLDDGRKANLYVEAVHLGYFGVIAGRSDNQATAISEALNCGASKFIFPEGEVLCYGASANPSNCVIEMAGCTLKAHVDGNGAAINTNIIRFGGSSSANAGANITIQNGTFDGNMVNVDNAVWTTYSYGSRIFFEYTGTLKFQNCAFQNFNNGALTCFRVSGRNSIENCRFREIGIYAVYVNASLAENGGIDYDTDSVWDIVGNQFIGPDGAATQGSNVLVTGTMTSPTTKSKNLLFSGNRLEAASLGYRGIGSIVTDNYFDTENRDFIDNPTLGFCATLDNYGAIVTGNVFKNFLGIGLEILVASTDASGESSGTKQYDQTQDLWNDTWNPHNAPCVVANNIFISMDATATLHHQAINLGGKVSNAQVKNNSFYNCLVYAYGSSTTSFTDKDDSGLSENLAIEGNQFLIDKDLSLVTAANNSCCVALINYRDIFIKNNSFFYKRPAGDTSTIRRAIIFTGNCWNAVVDGNRFRGWSEILSGRQVETTVAGGDNSDEYPTGLTVSNNIVQDRGLSTYAWLVRVEHNTANRVMGPVWMENNHVLDELTSATGPSFYGASPVVSVPTNLEVFDFVDGGTAGGSGIVAGGFLQLSTGSSAGSTNIFRLKNSNIGFLTYNNNPTTEELYITGHYAISFQLLDSSTFQIPAGGVPSDTQIKRIIFGKTYNGAYGIAGICYGFEIRFKTLYGFYHDGTTTTYVELGPIYNTAGFRTTNLNIMCMGGSYSVLHFGLNGFYKKFITNITGVGQFCTGNGVHLELTNGTAAVDNFLHVGEIKLHPLRYN